MFRRRSSSSVVPYATLFRLFLLAGLLLRLRLGFRWCRLLLFDRAGGRLEPGVGAARPLFGWVRLPDHLLIRRVPDGSARLLGVRLRRRHLGFVVVVDRVAGRRVLLDHLGRLMLVERLLVGHLYVTVTFTIPVDSTISDAK